MSEQMIRDLSRNMDDRLGQWALDTAMRFDAVDLSPGDCSVAMVDVLIRFLAHYIAHFFSMPPEMAGEIFGKLIDEYRKTCCNKAHKKAKKALQ